MWVVIVWVDPEYADDGYSKIIGPFSSQADALAKCEQFVHANVDELVPPGVATSSGLLSS